MPRITQATEYVRFIHADYDNCMGIKYKWMKIDSETNIKTVFWYNEYKVF